MGLDKLMPAPRKKRSATSTKDVDPIPGNGIDGTISNQGEIAVGATATTAVDAGRGDGLLPSSGATEDEKLKQVCRFVRVDLVGSDIGSDVCRSACLPSCLPVCPSVPLSLCPSVSLSFCCCVVVLCRAFAYFGVVLWCVGFCVPCRWLAWLAAVLFFLSSSKRNVSGLHAKPVKGRCNSYIRNRGSHVSTSPRSPYEQWPLIAYLNTGGRAAAVHAREEATQPLLPVLHTGMYVRFTAVSVSSSV